MTIANTPATGEEVVMGKTHFQIPGYDELIAFSAKAIANDTRWPEMQKAIIDKLISGAAVTGGQSRGNSA